MNKFVDILVSFSQNSLAFEKMIKVTNFRMKPVLWPYLFVFGNLGIRTEDKILMLVPKETQVDF